METKEELFKELQEFLNQRLSLVRVKDEPLSLNLGTCFTVSKLACKILRKLGYNCYVKRVCVIVGDNIGRRMFLEQEKTCSFDKNEIIKAGGWCLGLGAVDENSLNDFHFVIDFPDDKELMDLTFGQANRPEKGINAEGYWCGYDSLPECIIKMSFIEKDIDSIPLYYLEEATKWREETIVLGYKNLKRFKKK